ncbi:Dynamin_N domain-containing protein/Dynamin_M domain-containing protein/GED domain-containing protein [Cephalotus follicularis]|uniref:Dynamin_N domain-containing protein/Dynamin_M domain-containing protein/GED domain-containing protein n=1 Tax=Cephalotus follicularis TaxID=3775 RepID=A0A1Q3CJ48_CEPFO|nr:Dynamin_N domain-containing protein/Dynamin_M domain-containing protein/GED domain-containing protein [Cephalotus follicularis]
MGGGKDSASKRQNLKTIDKAEHSHALVPAAEDMVIDAPIISSYNDRIRPALDAVDKLRRLMVMKEGIQLPTIVVVGDQSSGKSSVLESLAGINLPRGQGICTRVPLIMRLENQANLKSEFSLEFNGKLVQSDEADIANAIYHATEEIAGHGKGISKIPLTLVVKKKGVPDLTMVDLPGITRVPVHGQPEDIYEQIADIIMEYIRPEESIILNVLSATVDFPTCESIRMSQQVDKTGERTLAVVTKADKAPEGLLEKVTADDVNIGLGYVCVRNRIGDESYEEARKEEARLFESHSLLSKIDKSMVGIPVLAQKLVQIQANSIARNLPEIVRKINEKLNASASELNRMPKTVSSVAEAMTSFMRMIGFVKESLRKILLRGEFDEYPDNKDMHCTARLVEMLNQYSNKMQKCTESDNKKNFLVEEIAILEECSGINLPNFLPRNAFIVMLQKKVDGILHMSVDFIEKVWNYIEGVVIGVLMKHSENYYQLQISVRRAGNNLIAKIKKRSVDRVMEMVQMEKLTDYTCDPDYLDKCNNLNALRENFMRDVLVNHLRSSAVDLQGFGHIEVDHLRQQFPVLNQAFDLKMRMTAYWKIVLKRMVDSMALHLQFNVQNLVNNDMEEEMVNELIGPQGGGIERMLGDSPSVALKREKLSKSVQKLTESKEVLAQMMEKMVA